jgi:endonuclease/exonuclease/phosphatase family metal-dependent hydrolase
VSRTACTRHSSPDDGGKYSVPAFTPLIIRIDYVFHSPAFRSIAACVWPSSGGSDHRPVYARVAIVPPITPA